MAEEDEIDILGDFSFNSCLAQNNQGIPSCSDREDTVHPQWLLDSVSANWYDIQTKDSDRMKEGPSRRLTGNRVGEKHNRESHTTWSQKERQILFKEMSKYGRNIRKISQTLKTKTEAEIQALIEAEFGVHLETPSFELDKAEDGDTLTIAQEEVVTDDVTNVLSVIKTGTPTVPIPKRPSKKPSNVAKNSLLRPDVLKNELEVSSSEIFYEDDMIIGLTESVGSDMESDSLIQKMVKHKEKVKNMKKLGNHRRKVSRNYDRGKRNHSKDVLKSPRQRKDSSMSEESAKSSKMQIVFSSGQALPVSEGEQVIKIEKKKDSDPESDIDIDVDSDGERGAKRTEDIKVVEERVSKKDEAAPRNLQPMPKRRKKINLSADGGGGYTIMHTARGDLFEVRPEPRRERPRRPPAPLAEPLLPTRLYSHDNPAPYEVHINVSCLLAMDLHAHTSRAEVMGLAGGRWGPRAVALRAYRAAAAAAARTHCDMDPVSQAAAAAALHGRSLAVVCWHHSHPSFPPAPSATDLRTQRQLQRLEPARPLLGLITSQHWPPGRTATQYKCIRVEDTEDDEDIPTGFQFSVKLLPDLTVDNLPEYLEEVRSMLCGTEQNEYSVDMPRDICPQAKMSYLEKSISSMRHLMHSAGYEDSDPLIQLLARGIRHVFR